MVVPRDPELLKAVDAYFASLAERLKPALAQPRPLPRGPRRTLSACQAARGRRLRIEALETKMLLAGADLTFAPNAVSPANYTWADTSVENFLNSVGTPVPWADGDIAIFNQVGQLAVSVSGTVQAEGITFGGGGSTTLSQAGGGAIEMYSTGNDLTIEDDHVENAGAYSVPNDFIDVPISPGSSSAPLVKTGTGDVQIESANNSLPGGIVLQGGTVTVLLSGSGGDTTFDPTTTITVDAGTGASAAALVVTCNDSLSPVLENPIVIEAGELRVDTQGYELTMSGAISSTTPTNSTDDLVVSDTIANGTTTITGDMSGYAGGVTVISGSLIVSYGYTLGGDSLTIAGGRLDLGGNTYTPPSTFTFTSGDIADGELDLTSTLTTNIDSGDTGVISTTIYGSGGLAVDGSLTTGGGALFVLGNNSYTGTTIVDTGATLIYRWNAGGLYNAEYSIPGGYTSATGSGMVESEYAYFQATDRDALIWNGNPVYSNDTWETDHGNTNWLEPGATGPTSVVWTASNDAVFEEPVPGGVTPAGDWSDLMISGPVQVADHLTFMMGSNVVLSSGGLYDLLVFGNTGQTLLSQVPDSTQWLFVPIGSETGRGLEMVANANLYLGYDNESNDQYLGTTTLVSGDTVQFVEGGLGGGIVDGTLEGAVDIDAGSGAAGLAFANGNSYAYSLDIPINLISGECRIDPEGKTITLNSIIGDGGSTTPGKLLIGDSVGGGTVVMDPLDGSGDHTANTYSGGTVLQDGILNVNYDTDLGTAPSSPATNIEFTGDAGLQWGTGFTLYYTRNIVIDAGINATFDLNGYSDCEIDGIISGPGSLTVINNGKLTLTGTNTFTGVTTIATTGGTLLLANSDALAGSTFDTSGAGTLSFGSLTSATFGGLQGSNDLTLENASSAPVDLTVGGNDDDTIFAGEISGGSASPTTLEKTGTGTLDVTGSIATTQLTLDEGSILVDASGALASGILLAFGIDSTGVLELDGNDVTLGGLNSYSVAADTGTPVIEVADVTAGTSILTVATSSADTYRGSIINAPGRVAGNSLQLVVDGTGSLTVAPEGTNNNTYYGGTIVSAGTLIVGNSNGIAAGSSLTVGNPSAFGDIEGYGDDFSRGGFGDFSRGGGSGLSSTPPAPVVTSIQYAGPSIVYTTSLTFTAEFSQPVDGALASDFTVDAVGATASITAVSGTGYQCTIVVAVSGSGTVELQLTSAGAIANAGCISLSSANLPIASEAVVVNPTLYWSGMGAWTSGTWTLADGAPTAWIDGSSIVVAAGSELQLAGTVNVGSFEFQGAATITGGTIVLEPSPAVSQIIVDSSVAVIDSAIAGGGLSKLGSGILILNGTLSYVGTTSVAAGILEALSPLPSAATVTGGQAIVVGSVLATDTAFAALDPALTTLVDTLYARDGEINRADMMQILGSAVVDNAVSDDAEAVLEALTTTAAAAELGEPNYVAVLAADVVQGNAANANYLGAPLGDLASQTSDAARATALTDLLGKWFLGTDLPAASSGSYIVTAGSLYGDGSGPSSQDMAQGGLGDCYLVAALGSLADSDPAAIENMFIDNGDGTYTVRFYYQNSTGAFVPDYVTVNSLLPGFEGANGPTTVYAGEGQDGAWIALLEKAYAQWNETGREGRDGTNSYASLSGGNMGVVDQQITGSAAATYYPSGGSSAEAAIIAAIQSGEAVTAGVFTDGSAQFGSLSLVNDHAYDVVSYDSDPNSPSYDTFTLKNPWGDYEPQPLTGAELAEFSPWVNVAGGGTDGAADSQPVGAMLGASSAASPATRGLSSATSTSASIKPDASSAAAHDAVLRSDITTLTADAAAWLWIEAPSNQRSDNHLSTRAVDYWLTQSGMQSSS